ncbi:sugar transferase [Neptuniibacter sp. 1_MG-2023]|jgi:lipopolysaccharide/colanic/teichoic acid biosynthesis glycosyltransferase|uniref:sugar transferase n=1 Tax=Neptuniibacter sp. 1_MG-2023 TaxID=3062662 RepID=UPI0026E4935B|nr:sugar transferase [Neptuniibacter sp. 1_MG-2023]MDO6592768.1 sugar transferase [Neptuniibacter sp. 1_MG-2023]
MIRFLDVMISLIGVFFLFPLFILLFIMGLFDTGSPLFFQERVGKNEKAFILVKFRTMKKNSTSVATHLMNINAVTRFGHFLRKSKLDELPQLWNVLRGDMSLVGPRPGLFNQPELISERRACGVYSVRPGITGLSQISGIDMSTPCLIAKTDKRMIDELTLVSYVGILFKTLMGAGSGDRIKAD